jgi:hypothetical protein
VISPFIVFWNHYLVSTIDPCYHAPRYISTLKLHGEVFYQLAAMQGWRVAITREASLLYYFLALLRYESNWYTATRKRCQGLQRLYVTVCYLTHVSSKQQSLLYHHKCTDVSRGFRLSLEFWNKPSVGDLIKYINNGLSSLKIYFI